MIKNLLPMKETRVQSLGQEDLRKEMATHSICLSGKSHEHRSLVGYSPQGCKRVGNDIALNNNNDLIGIRDKILLLKNELGK